MQLGAAADAHRRMRLWNPCDAMYEVFVVSYPHAADFRIL